MKAIAAPILLALAAAPAAAEETFPDIVGIWTGEGSSVAMGGAGKAEYAEDAITQVVTEQRGRRFAGEIHSTSGSEPFEKPFVGVFVDETRFLWSEPTGLVEGRLIDADTILSCYIDTSDASLVAACNTLKREH